MNYVYCAHREYSFNVFKKLKKKYKNFILIDDKKKLTLSKLKKVNPKFVFFPDWSWFVPEEIIKNFNCICIHESDLPKFRGGRGSVSGYKNAEAFTLIRELND